MRILTDLFVTAEDHIKCRNKRKKKKASDRLLYVAVIAQQAEAAQHDREYE